MIEQIAAREFREHAGCRGLASGRRRGVRLLPNRIVRGGRAAGAGDRRAAGLGPHQPDVDVRHDGVTVRLVSTADDYGLSERDVAGPRDLAVAREQGLSADPSAVRLMSSSTR